MQPDGACVQANACRSVPGGGSSAADAAWPACLCACLPSQGWLSLAFILFGFLLMVFDVVGGERCCCRLLPPFAGALLPPCSRRPPRPNLLPPPSPTNTPNSRPGDEHGARPLRHLQGQSLRRSVGGAHRRSQPVHVPLRPCAPAWHRFCLQFRAATTRANQRRSSRSRTRSSALATAA